MKIGHPAGICCNMQSSNKKLPACNNLIIRQTYKGRKYFPKIKFVSRKDFQLLYCLIIVFYSIMYGSVSCDNRPFSLIDPIFDAIPKIV